MLKFYDLTIKEEELFRQYEKAHITIDNAYYGSELNFENTIIWGAEQYAKYAEKDGVLYVCYDYGKNYIFCPPYVQKPQDFVDALKVVYDHCKSVNKQFKLKKCTKSMVDMLANSSDSFAKRLTAEYDRDSSEYLYLPSDLIELKGKKYHSKRNHISKFLSEYKYQLQEYTPDKFDEIINFAKNWAQGAKLESIEWEMDALVTALKKYDELNLQSTLIYIDGTLAAFALSYININNVGVVLFEKAKREYNGIYATINNIHAKRFLSDCKVINRQEDMGVAGLRKAKESYYPTMLSDKYKIMGD